MIYSEQVILRYGSVSTGVGAPGALEFPEGVEPIETLTLSSPGRITPMLREWKVVLIALERPKYVVGCTSSMCECRYSGRLYCVVRMRRSPSTACFHT